jgi:FkbM family methyltransferase
MKLPNAVLLGLLALCLLLLALRMEGLRREVAALSVSNRTLVELARSLTKDEPASIGGEHFVFRDVLSSASIRIVSNEIPASYAIIDRIAFNDGDVVLDVGAHIGMVSAYIGRKHPNVKIYAFEPSRTNHRNLVHNLLLNRIDNVIPVERGIGERDGILRLCMNENNTGASQTGTANCAWLESIYVMEVNGIFDQYRIDKVRLLKIDCEGCETSFFGKISAENLRRIEYITGELHCESAEQERKLLPAIDRLLTLVDPDKLSLTQYVSNCPRVTARLQQPR